MPHATTPYIFKPTERPPMPGSPFAPSQPRGRRLGYGVVGVLIGLTSGLGNAFIQVNLGFVQGSLGLYSDEVAWLTAAYLMTYVCGNLVLVRFRQQFGLELFVRAVLVGYAGSTVVHLLVHSLWSAIVVRALSGLASVGLASLTIFYCMQGMTPKWKLAGIMLGISVPQLATPVARIVSPHLLEWDDWRMGYWFELGLTLTMLAGILAFTLPPSERSKPFQRLDAITIGLLGPGLWLLVAVFTEARIYWWTDTPWLGWALAASVVLVAIALTIEHLRSRPLIDTHWLGTRQLLRLFFAAATIRILLSEQTYEAVGFLSLFGFLNDQMVILNVVILAASVAGMVVSIFTLNPADTLRSFTIACFLVAIGSGLDAFNTNLTRPEQLYLSQALIGFGALYFIGPAMVTGLARVNIAGSTQLASWLVVFNLSQSVCGLVGNTLLGTFQTVREKLHSHELIQSMVMTNPLVSSRVHDGAGLFGGTVGDTTLVSARSLVLLAQQTSREANILAYNDVFLLICAISAAACLWGVLAHFSILRRGEPAPVAAFLASVKAAAARARLADQAAKRS